MSPRAPETLLAVMRTPPRVPMRLPTRANPPVPTPTPPRVPTSRRRARMVRTPTRLPMPASPEPIPTRPRARTPASALIPVLASTPMSLRVAMRTHLRIPALSGIRILVRTRTRFSVPTRTPMRVHARTRTCVAMPIGHHRRSLEHVLTRILRSTPTALLPPTAPSTPRQCRPRMSRPATALRREPQPIRCPPTRAPDRRTTQRKALLRLAIPVPAPRTTRRSLCSPAMPARTARAPTTSSRSPWTRPHPRSVRRESGPRPSPPGARAGITRRRHPDPGPKTGERHGIRRHRPLTTRR